MLIILDITVDYNTLYMVDPNQSIQVEANPDPTGLKIGIIYAINLDKKEFLYHRFLCKNDGTLNITELTGDDISYYGNRDDATLQAKGKIRETEKIPFDMVKETVYNLPSTQPNKSHDNALSEVAKTIATGIQTSMVQAQLQINQMTAPISKSLGVKVDDTPPQSKDQMKENSKKDVKNKENQVQSKENEIKTKMNHQSHETLSNDSSVVNKWELELKRAKEAKRKHENQSENTHSSVENNETRVISNDSSASVEGVLIPQLRVRSKSYSINNTLSAENNDLTDEKDDKSYESKSKSTSSTQQASVPPVITKSNSIRVNTNESISTTRSVSPVQSNQTGSDTSNDSQSHDSQSHGSEVNKHDKIPVMNDHQQVPAVDTGCKCQIM